MLSSERPLSVSLCASHLRDCGTPQYGPNFVFNNFRWAEMDRLKQELKVPSIREFYGTQCRAGKELFIRELQRKATGIFGHKKRKHKIKKTKQ